MTARELAERIVESKELMFVNWYSDCEVEWIKDQITAELEKRDKRIAALREALRYVVEGEPPNDGSARTACTFCDMGGAGYSSRGDRHHDDVRDVCPVHVAEQALNADSGDVE